MRNSSLRWSMAVMGLFLGAGAQFTQAQQAAPTITPAPILPAGSSAELPIPVMGATAGPLLNPAVNPYLNPYLMGTPIPNDVAVMSILNAQKAGGGIGSGAISGVRDLEQGRKSSAQKKPQSNASAPVPTAGERAGRYFYRGQGRFGARAGTYFQRTGDRFDQ